MATLRPQDFATPAEFESAWLALRKKHITSTDCAALFGFSSRTTLFELWHEKAGIVPNEFEGNERTDWGTALQDAIAAKIAADNGWWIDRNESYVYDETDRIGASFDFDMFAVCEDMLAGVRPIALLEIKNVDSLVFRNEWAENPNVPGGYEAPPHIELQAQHQMEVRDIDLCYIGVCIGGNRSVVLPRERDREVGRAIRQAVRAFWLSIESNAPPPPVMPEDAAMVIALHQQAGGAVIIADEILAAAITDYHAQGEAIRKANEVREVSKAAILQRIGDADKVVAPGFTLSAPRVDENEGTLITADMIGQRIGERAGYRLFRTYAKKAPKVVDAG